MWKLIKIIMLVCTLFCAYVFLEALLEDDDTTTTEEVVTTDDDEDDTAEMEEDDEDEDDVYDSSKPRVKKTVKRINNATFKEKVADFSVSKTSCNKNVKAVVVLYSEKYDLSVNMVRGMKKIVNDYDYKFYAMRLDNGMDVVKAYGLTDIPTVIVAKNGKIYTKKGYLTSSDLGKYLQTLK